MSEKGVEETKRNESNTIGQDAEALLSEVELDHLLNAAPTANASDTLQRLILDDFDSLQSTKENRSIVYRFWDHCAETLNSIFSGTNTETSVVASIAPLGRLAPMTAFSILGVVGFLVGIQTKELPSQNTEEYALADAEIFEYFSATLVDTAYFDEGDSLWRVE